MNFLAPHKNKIIFTIALLFTLIVYGRAHHAMLVDDGMSGIWEVLKNQNGGYWNSYGFDAYYYILYAFTIVCYKIFGLNDRLWFIIFAIMHAINTSLIFILCNKLKKVFDLNNWFPVVSAVLFLIGAYQSENIIWGATQHYAIGLMLFLVSCIYIINIKKIGIKQILILTFIQAIALTTIEMAFVFPAIYLVFVSLLYWVKYIPYSIKDFFIKIFLLQLFCCVLYLVIYYLDRGALVPHTGNKEVLNIFSANAIRNYTTIQLKYYTLFPYLGSKDKILALIQNPFFCATVLIVPIAFSLIIKGKAKLLYIFALLGAYIFLLPYLNGYVATLFRYENDRHQYFSFVFMNISLALLLSRANKYIISVFFFFLLSINIYWTYDNVSVRRQSGLLHKQFIEKYPFDNAKKTYIINTPVNLKGAYVFRYSFRFPIDYEVVFNKNIFDTQVQIMGYIAQGINDKFEVKKTSDSSYYVNSTTSGVWYVYNSVGAQSYETPNYKVEMGEWGFDIKFKHKLTASERLLVYNDGKFEEVK